MIKTMRSICIFEPHLVLHDMTLLGGGEWSPTPTGWLFVGIKTGSAYWLHPRRNHELVAGSVLLLSSAAKGTIRSSQLSETQLIYFRIEPKLLTGLATFHEEQFLCRAQNNDSLCFQVLPPEHLLAKEFHALSENRTAAHLGLRLRLLDLFVRSLGTEVRGETAREDDGSSNARRRLAELLRELPACELMKMEFGDLARELCCTPRHLSRTFHEVVGVSFRQKQAEMRVNRAKELLATTNSKVLDVALESGYQSLSLFNAIFKRHVGLTPARWREHSARRRSPRSGNDLLSRQQFRAGI